MSTRLRRFVWAVAPGWREPAACAGCGGEFTCGASLLGCWCSEIKLSDETRARLRALYSDCLCRKCLEAAANNGTKIEND